MPESVKLRLPDMQPLLSWYHTSKRDLPWRHTRDPYRIWVSEIMLQQTRVEAVMRYYQRFLERLPDVQALADCPEGELLKLWEGLGYYSRVRNMQRAARVIVQQHAGRFPRTYEEILALPGIGEYTAGAIGSFAFDLPLPAVDGNVLRVVARLTALEEDVLSPKTRRAVTEAVAQAQPALCAADFNQAMIELGALVCLPNGAPKCAECPLAATCLARKAGLQERLPIRKKNAPRKIQHKTVLILREGERVALRRRPSDGLLAALYEPFCLEGALDSDAVQAFLQAQGLFPLHITPIGEAKHIFTHLEWHMCGFEVILPLGSITKMEQNGAKNPFINLFFAQRDEVDTRYALPSAYAAYRAYM